MKEHADKNSISIRRILILIFILSMLISVSGIGYVIFSNWISSAKQTTEKLAEDMNREIYNKIDRLMHIPEHINEINRKVIDNGILDILDEKSREKFFVGVLSSHDKEIYSFSYGTENGEYFGARRNEKGVIEIMRNTADTGGNSWYYSVNEDLTAGELVVQAGKFDPRTRAWYKAAKKAGGPMFSPIYKHFVMDDLTVSTAWPVYNDQGELQGVLGTHLLLSGIGNFLAEIVRDNNGYAFIAEKNTGELIANSLGIDNFTVLQDGTVKRNTLSGISNSTIRQAYEQYNAVNDKHFLFESKDESLYVNVEEYHKEGLDWVIVSAIPESLLITNVSRNIQMTVFLVIIAVLLSVAVFFLVTRKLLKPINDLLELSEKLSSDDLSQRVVIVRNDEIGRISEAFNKVADKMYLLINNLEDTVKERTDELYRTNKPAEKKILLLV